MGKRNNPKAILFICEGVSDKDALENLLNEIFNPIRVVPIVYRGDITTSFDQRVIKSEIGNAIKGSLNQDYSSTPALLRLEDLVGVVLLTDTDGCYISDSSVIYDHRYRHPFYQPDVIFVDSGVPEQDSEIGGAGFRFSRSKIPVFAVQDTAPVQA